MAKVLLLVGGDNEIKPDELHLGDTGIVVSRNKVEPDTDVLILDCSEDYKAALEWSTVRFRLGDACGNTEEIQVHHSYDMSDVLTMATDIGELFNDTVEEEDNESE